jgi:beta-N-acetylhexosaminidase
LEYPGALVISGISGLALTEGEKAFLRDEKVGGVVLGAHNFSDPAQLAELVNSIQALRDEWPLFIATNHEGGKATSFSKGFTAFPSMWDLSRYNSPKLTYEVHAVMAKELSACGVNLSFSPVCDVRTNANSKVSAERAFGESVEEVDKHVSAAIRGWQTSGVLGCAKHFPGHGDTMKDSRDELPLMKNSVMDLRAREVQPFVKAVKSRVEMVMMAHLQVDALDEKLPTSLSPKAYEFLRDETKFTKIVLTDDMELGALSRWESGEAAVTAIQAGADMLLYGTAEGAMKAVTALREALKTKKIKKEAFLDKLARVEACKAENFKTYQPIYIPKITTAFNSQESKKALEAIKVASLSAR